VVKCSDCGYLAARNRDTRELDEVERVFRENGKPPNVTVAGRNPYCRQEIMPLCFARSFDFVDLYNKLTSRRANIEDNIATILNEERHCDSFIEWKQGFTPKEHREMMDRKEMLQWQTEQKKQDRRWRIIEVVILIIGAGLFALLGALIQRGF
jgi:hypothetical protein